MYQLSKSPRYKQPEKGKKKLSLPFEKKKKMVSIEGLTVEFGGFTLLNSLSFVINRKDRIALVGKNGAGKSRESSFVNFFWIEISCK